MGSRGSVLSALVGAVVVVLAGCGNSTAAPAATAAIQPPQSITSAGKLAVCTDPTYPPAEYLASDGATFLGFDIDIANGIAKRFGVPAELVNTKYDGIIPALNGGKCDVILSALPETPDRATQVNFVDYVDVTSALVVKPGNPKTIHSLDDLCGKNVAIIIGEAWKPILATQDGVCKGAGRPGINLSQYNASTDEVLQLELGRVDTIVTNTLNAAYVVSQPANAGQMEIATATGPPFEKHALGAGMRLADTALTAAVRKAVEAMYTDGTIKAIFDKYHMTQVFVPHVP